MVVVMDGRWTIELCVHCADGRSTRPLIECQHIGPDEAGPVFEVVPCDDAAIERAAKAIYLCAYLESDSSVYPPAAVPWENASTVARSASIRAATAAFRAAGETDDPDGLDPSSSGLSEQAYGLCPKGPKP